MMMDQMTTWLSQKVARAHAEFERFRFVNAIAGIIKTKPIALVRGGPTVVTMIGSRDVLPYLLSLKSFARFCGLGRVVVLDDGTLQQKETLRLANHIPGVDIVRMSDVVRGKCQQGGCWERLCLIGHLAATDYVIQLDSDMLTLREPRRLIELVEAQSPFTMAGDLEGASIVSGREASAFAREKSGDFFQLRFERALDRVPSPDNWSYVRGCAALSAFPPASVSLARIEALHEMYKSLVGVSEWRSWGSEQVTSNSLIAAMPAAAILPTTDYCSHFGNLQLFNYCDAAMIHFLGTHRYENGTYRTLASHVVQELEA